MGYDTRGASLGRYVIRSVTFGLSIGSPRRLSGGVASGISSARGLGLTLVVVGAERGAFERVGDAVARAALAAKVRRAVLGTG